MVGLTSVSTMTAIYRRRCMSGRVAQLVVRMANEYRNGPEAYSLTRAHNRPIRIYAKEDKGIPTLAIST